MTSLKAPALGIALAFTPGVQAHAGVLWNGSFENASLAAWTVSQGTASVTSTAHSGRYGMAVGPGTAETVVSQYVANLTPGQAYLVSAWMFAGAGTSGGAVLAVSGSSGLAATPATPSGSWQQFRQVYTVGANGALTIYLGKVPSSQSSSISWDDVSLRPLPPANGGFESGSLLSWNTTQGTASVSTAAHSGQYGLDIHAAGTIASQTIAGLVPGQRYTVSAWVIASASTSGGVELSLSGANGTVGTPANASASWGEISQTYTVGADGGLTISLAQLASSPLALSWDDVTITSGAESGVPIRSVLTYHNDQARTGQNTSEYILKPSNVSPSSF